VYQPIIFLKIPIRFTFVFRLSFQDTVYALRIVGLHCTQKPMSSVYFFSMFVSLTNLDKILRINEEYTKDQPFIFWWLPGLGSGRIYGSELIPPTNVEE